MLRTVHALIICLAATAGAQIQMSTPLRGWRYIGDRSLSFYEKHGFRFEASDHGWADRMVEVILTVPPAFTDGETENKLYCVAISSDEVSCAVAVREKEGKRRAIIWLSRAMMKTAEFHFRYTNSDPSVGTGFCYTIPADSLWPSPPAPASQ